MTSGVPQGSVLGPILFTAAVHSLPADLSRWIKICADDAKLYRSISDSTDTNKLQKDLDTLTARSGTWQLPFHYAKCKVIHNGSRDQKSQMQLRHGRPYAGVGGRKERSMTYFGQGTLVPSPDIFSRFQNSQNNTYYQEHVC